MELERNISRPLAPEDIRRDDYVCVLHVVEERKPGFFDELSPWKEVGVRRYRALPDEDALPMRVLDVCLPFVLVVTADGKQRMLDVRRAQLARVTTEYGRRAFRRFKAVRAKSDKTL